MIDLHEHNLVEVVEEQISGNPASLRHPVQPKQPAASGLADQVVLDHHIDRRVEFDRGHFRASEDLAGVDVTKFVALHCAENAPEAAHDAGLLAVRDFVFPHHMAADRLLVPTLLHRALDGFIVGVSCRGLVVEFIAVFAESDPHAFRVADRVVFDDPPLAPVRADQPELLDRRGRPVGGGVHHGEATHGDVIASGFARIKNRLPHIDLGVACVRIEILELGVNRRVLVVHLAEPEAGFIQALVIEHLFRVLRIVVFEDHRKVVHPAQDIGAHFHGFPLIPTTRGRDDGSAQNRAVDVVFPDFNSEGVRRGDMEGDFVAFASAINPREFQPVSVSDAANNLPEFACRHILCSFAPLGGGRQDLAVGISHRLQPGEVQELGPRLGLAYQCRSRRLEHYVFIGGLHEPVPINVNCPRVVGAAIGLEPIPTDQVGVGIEIAEEAVRQRDLPGVVLNASPTLDGFRALDDDLRARRGGVNDALGIRGSATRWVDLLAVDALVNNDGITRLREFRRRRDGFQRVVGSDKVVFRCGQSCGRSDGQCDGCGFFNHGLVDEFKAARISAGRSVMIASTPWAL